ncbi:MAG: hypothetical protein NTX25_21650 [Proteobacteria bacterium]|nr:hypothetical protein [Pseudomonadota bacterium]
MTADVPVEMITTDPVPAPKDQEGQPIVLPKMEPASPATPELEGLALICSNAASFKSLQTEFDVVCKDGKATEAFAKAYAAPYKGTGTPPLVTVKSMAANGISENIFLAVIEVEKPLSDVYKKLNDFNNVKFVAGVATVTQTVLSNTPASSLIEQGSLDFRLRIAISVGPINFADVNVQKMNTIALSGKQTVFASLSQLKAGDPANGQALLANGLSFMIKEGDKTRLVSVKHQKIRNRGQAQKAEATSIDIGRAFMKDSFTKANQ